MVTEHQYNTATKLERIGWLSAREPKMKFANLMHHFNEESLATCFHELDGKKAVGPDRVSKDEYGEDLLENLHDLVARMKRMAYRPGPVRETLIPKEGKPGSTRPLGIGNFEDKIFQKMMGKILTSIFEPLFLECSYGFRPGRGPHDAIYELREYLFRNNVRTVIDVDLENYFGTIDHKILETFLRSKITDQKFMRYIIRMFKAGVLTAGELRINEVGVPQGSICSPILANVMAHYVIDQWFETVVKEHCTGKVEMFRYADDMVICCDVPQDAERIKAVLGKRLGKFNLKMQKHK
jgi:RNA-directed DNA polymerase